MISRYFTTLWLSLLSATALSAGNKDGVNSILSSGLECLVETVRCQMESTISEQNSSISQRLRELQKELNDLHRKMETFDERIEGTRSFLASKEELSKIEIAIQECFEKIESCSSDAEKKLSSCASCRGWIDDAEAVLLDLQNDVDFSKEKLEFYIQLIEEKCGLMKEQESAVGEQIHEKGTRQQFLIGVVEKIRQKSLHEEKRLRSVYEREKKYCEDQQHRLKKDFFDRKISRRQYEERFVSSQNRQNQAIAQLNRSLTQLNSTYIDESAAFQEEFDAISRDLDLLIEKHQELNEECQKCETSFADEYKALVQPLKMKADATVKIWGSAKNLKGAAIPCFEAICKASEECCDENIEKCSQLFQDLGDREHPKVTEMIVSIERAIAELKLYQRKLQMKKKYEQRHQNLQARYLAQQSEVESHQWFKRFELQRLEESRIQAQDRLVEVQSRVQDLCEQYQTSDDGCLDGESLRRLFQDVEDLSACLRGESVDFTEDTHSSLMTGKRYMAIDHNLESWMSSEICQRDHHTDSLKFNTMRSWAQTLDMCERFDLSAADESFKHKVIDTLRASLCEAEIELLHMQDPCRFLICHCGFIFDLQTNGDLQPCFDLEMPVTDLEPEDHEVLKRVFHLYPSAVALGEQSLKFQALHAAYATVMATAFEEDAEIRRAYRDLAMDFLDCAVDVSPLGAGKVFLEVVLGVSVCGEPLSLSQRVTMAMMLPPGLKIFEKGFEVFKKVDQILRKRFGRARGISVARVVGSAKEIGATTSDAVKGFAKTLEKFGEKVPDWPQGISFPVSPLHLKKHMATNIDGFTQQAGIKGTHNLTEFNKAAEKYRIKITKTTSHPSVDGVKQVEYKILKADGSGQYKALPFTKTVYDPTKISDDEMLYLGQVASAKKFPGAGVTDPYNSKAGGVSFRVYTDGSGGIKNVHPRFENE